MTAVRSLLCIAACVCLDVVVSPNVNAAPPAKLSFNKDVQPILAENCYACHGADPSSRKAELRLDRREYAFAPHKDFGPAIVPENPDESPLVQRIESADEKKRMPPTESHKTLDDKQIALLRQWIAEGAEYEEHWAFVTPVRPATPELPPAVTVEMDARLNPIDHFIRARLAKEMLVPAPEADRRTLLRRATLDLTGMIPTPEEVDAFLADESSDAYEKAVDRLLASPRWGEHRTRYWLDYARYADTHGIHFDNRRSMWPYRDYVVRAFNANKPFDTFIREQLAGDLLPARTIDELAATGFVRNNMTTNEGGTIPEEVFVNQTRDRVEAFGATFLALTTGCAACHDHKFDPLTQKDHYQLAAFLGNTAEKPWDLNIATPDPVLRIPKPGTEASAEFILNAGADLKEKLDVRRARARELTAAWLAAGHSPQRVDDEGLEIRLRLDEGSGDVLKNSAPGTKTPEFKADTNPLVWGENSWLWPSMRMDIFTRLRLGDHGDVEADEPFSAGGWLFLRAKPGGGARTGTGSGSLLSRMGDGTRKGGAGWDLYQEGGQFILNLHAASDTPEDDGKKTDDAKGQDGSVAKAGDPPPPAMPEPKHAIRVITNDTFLRDEWLHVFFTYDGSRSGRGVSIYVNGKTVGTSRKIDSLTKDDSIRTDAAMHVGRRDDYEPMRETRFQDVRFYKRELSPEEVASLPFEHVAAEIVARQPDPAKWTTDEAFVVADRFFLGEKDSETIDLAAAVANHDKAFEALTVGGDPVLIAREKDTPAYADVLNRGDYYSRSERVGPAVPHFLPDLPKGAPSNRLGLAEWLLAPEQPLFSRVTVNRMWQEVFGRGLVETAGDFGIMGDRPSHPDLLDWLAVEFRESGWNVKQLYRLLVTSATYRQAAITTPEKLEKDPGNKFLARGPRFRMDGEMLRDNALLASGLLVEKLGGPPVKPYQPAGIWQEVAMPESDTRFYVQDKGEGLYRRSVYTFWKRASMPASLETFDATSREVVCTRRARTNTPLQAFVTMNDPQWVEAARKLAERAIKAAPSDEERIDFLARATLARPMNEREAAVVERGLEIFQNAFRKNGANTRSLLGTGDSSVDHTLAPAEIAAWTMVASQFLNLDEFLTK